MNLIVINGNLTKDSETRFTQSGKPITNFTVASNYFAKKDEKKTTFINCFYWGNHSYTKGQRVTVTGRLEESKWKDDEGEHSMMKVNCNSVCPHERKQEKTLEETTKEVATEFNGEVELDFN